jgi:hypothetical protein
MFSLDIFEGHYGFWGTLLGLLIHNIPSFIVLVALLISWKYEIVGGIAFILGGIFYIIKNIINPFDWYMLSWFASISIPAFIIGILFLIGWFRKKRLYKRK